MPEWPARLLVVRIVAACAILVTLILLARGVRHGEIRSFPDDPMYQRQWSLGTSYPSTATAGSPGIGVAGAWATSRCSPRVIIAIVDTGIDISHPDLAHKLVGGESFVRGTRSVQDDNGHGTGVAGVIAAATDNGRGIAGICPEGRLMPIKVADSAGHTNDREVARGLRWAVDHGAKILNVSLGTEDIAPMRDAVRYAYRRNVLVVAATPGDPTPYPAPARYPHVLSVAASDTASRPLNPAPHGVPHLVLAPGDGILTTTLGGGYGLFCPCVSIAAPAVSGIAALIFSIRPDLSVDAVISAIELGARPLAAQHSPDSVRGWGIVDAERSVQIALALPPGGGNVQMPHAQVASVLSPQSKSWTEPQFPPLESTPP